MKNDTAGSPRREIKFRRIAGAFAICRLPPDAPIPAWAQAVPFFAITRSAEELSIVCLAGKVPQDVRADSGWACFKLEGPFPFLQSGILVSFIGPLAQNGIPIFAISTFDTDYVLLKEEFVDAALSVLVQAGHQLL
jgi:uncharacterized protein